MKGTEQTSGLEHHLQPDEHEAIERALLEGRITRQEHDYFLRKQYGIESNNNTQTTENRIWPTIIIAATLLFILGVGTLFLEGGITGYVTSTIEETTPLGLTYNTNATFVLAVNNTTTLKLSGTITDGQASIRAHIGNNTLLVYAGNTSSLEGLWVDKKSYALNETVSISINPIGNYSYWLTDANGTKTPVGSPLITTTPGTYLLEAISNATKIGTTFTVRNDTNNSLDVRAAKPTLTFTKTCTETCLIGRSSNITLSINVSENATLVIDDMTTTATRTNNAPIQVATIPDMTINGTATIDLAPYFTDPDNDTLSYEVNNLVGVIENITGSALSLQGTIPGTYTVTIYASDLQAITTATFTITIVGNTPVTTNQTNTNQTTNNTQNTTQRVNQTNNNTVTNTNQATSSPKNDTNITTSQTTTPANALGCSNPNINLRPPECFGNQFDAAFEKVVAPLKDKNQGLVGRFTRYGNLIIKGQVIQQSTATAGNKDFTIGYTQQNGFVNNYVATAWIDTNGNLQLRGTLYEEQGGLTAPQYDTFIVQNNNGLTLGYFNERTGDLYLKGNIVQLGKP